MKKSASAAACMARSITSGTSCWPNEMVSLLRMPPQSRQCGSGSPARTRSSTSCIGPRMPQPQHMKRRMLPCTSITSCAEFPASWRSSAPLWAGEAEVVTSYWSSPKRTRDTDLLWLRRQCFKEFWGSGVGKYDRGGVVLGQLKNLLAKGAEIDVTIDRYEMLEALDGVRAEYSHYCAFADLYDELRPAGTAKLNPQALEPCPEEDALTAMRYRHQDEHGALGMRACKFTEGGYCTLFSAGMALKGRAGVDGKIALACGKVYDDEFEH